MPSSDETLTGKKKRKTQKHAKTSALGWRQLVLSHKRWLGRTKLRPSVAGDGLAGTGYGGGEVSVSAPDSGNTTDSFPRARTVVRISRAA